MRIAVLVPVLDRPHRADPLARNLRACTPDARLVFICDPGDAAQIKASSLAGEVLIHQGGYASKINAGCRETTEPLVALAADDVMFQAGWLKAAERHIERGAQVVGLNDLRKRPTDHATHFVLTREYAGLPTIDGQPGPLFDGYRHNFPDRELIETATKRGVYTYAPDAIVEHRHHLDGNAPLDATYEKGLQTFHDDRRLFRRRSGLWA